MKNSVQRGKVLELSSATAYLSGDLVLEGAIVGVALTDASGGVVVCQVSEVFEVASTGAIAQGDAVYCDAAQGSVSTTNTDTYAGVAISAAANNKVKVLLGY
jgi:predicted RecA/RadA family phage recombinase